VCSDAASEGLNLQTASVLINVDVPWNPARLLQRFGRIDRFGQKAKELYFYNLIYPNSIEDRMYSRLHGRNVQFREILGNTPEVVTADYYNNLVDDSIYQIDNNYDLQFKNSRVRISDNDKLSLSEFILDKLKSRSDLVVLENQILYNSLLYEYSLSSFESDFLNVFHPLVQEIIAKNLEGIDLKFIVNKDKQNVMPIWLSGNSSFQLCRKEELISLLIAPDNFDQGSLVSFDLNNTDLLSEIKSCLNYVGDIINPFESFNEFIRIDFFDELHLS
jgi:hypothetical protein